MREGDVSWCFVGGRARQRKSEGMRGKDRRVKDLPSMRMRSLAPDEGEPARELEAEWVLRYMLTTVCV